MGKSGEGEVEEKEALGGRRARERKRLLDSPKHGFCDDAPEIVSVEETAYPPC